MRVYFMTNIGRANSDETADDAIESATNNESGVDIGQIYKNSRSNNCDSITKIKITLRNWKTESYFNYQL